ncbi:MAG: DUF2079 domain-containing protein [Bacteroidota bacterium]
MLTPVWIFFIGYAPALLIYFCIHRQSVYVNYPRFALGNLPAGHIKDHLLSLSGIAVGLFLLWNLISGYLINRQNKAEDIIYGIIRHLSANAYRLGILALPVFTVLTFRLIPDYIYIKLFFCLALIGASLFCIYAAVHEFFNIPLARLTAALKTLTERQIYLAVIGISTLFCLWYIINSFFTHTSGDMATYMDVLYSFGTTGRPTWKMNRYNNFFGEHFIPTICLFSPFVVAWPSPVVLSVIQSIVVAFTTVPLFKLTRLKTGSALAGLAFAIAFLFHPAVTRLSARDFYELSMAPMLFFWLYYTYEKGQKKLFWLMFALLLGLREDISLTLACMGIFIIWTRKDLKTGITIITISAIYFVLVVNFLIPYFRAESFPFFALRYQDMLKAGPYNMKTLLLSIVSNPVFSAGFAVFNIERFIYLSLTFGPLLFLPFRQHKAFIMAVPSAVVIFFSSDYTMVHFGGHYSGYWLFPVYYGAVLGFCNLKTEKSAVLMMLPVAALSFNYIEGYLPPIAHPFYNRDFSPQWHSFGVNADALAENVPDTSRIEMSEFIMPYTAAKHRSVIAPYRYNTGYMMFEFSRKTTERIPQLSSWLLKEMREGKCHVVDYKANMVLTNNQPTVNSKRKTAEFIQLLQNRFESERQPASYAESSWLMETNDSEASDFANRTISPDYNETEHNANALVFGPFINIDPGNYHVIFRLKTDKTGGNDTLGTIDVAHLHPNEGGKIAGQQTITSGSFTEGGKYKNFSIPFRSDLPMEKVEFRIFYSGKGELTADYTELVKD